MNDRRGNSLGKGYLRSVRRIPRTLSWNSGGPRLLQHSEHQQNDDNEEQMAGNNANGGVHSRAGRVSMRRMVRFRMSSSADNDLSCSPTVLNSVSRQMAAGGVSSQPAPGNERENAHQAEADRGSSSSESSSWSASEGVPGFVSAQSAVSTDGRFGGDHQTGRDPMDQDLGASTLPATDAAVISTPVETNNEDADNRAVNASRRQRGRAGRRHNSYHRSRTRRRRSNNDSSTSGSRGSSTEPPVTRVSRRRSRSALEGNVDAEEESRRKFMGFWPHKASTLFCILATTLGVFNLSRFAVLTISFGGNFLIQFFLLSFIFGIPLLCFSASLGQFLGSGVIDMWKISPIFKGIGISLLLSQALVGIYSVVGVAWMFIYFRDSFIAPDDRYKWGNCYSEPRNRALASESILKPEESIPCYFQYRVLQRSSVNEAPSSFGSVIFEDSFNLAVIWMIVFIALSKGLRSYGKAACAFGTFPLLGFVIVCFKMLGFSSSKFGGYDVLVQTAWETFFTNTNCWLAAGREVFLTWGFFGAVVMQICAHNRYHHNLRRDITFVIMITLFVLLLSGLLATSCVQMITSKQRFVYSPSSFETLSASMFMNSNNQTNPFLHRISDYRHNNFISGISILPQHGSEPKLRSYSNYQPMRLATEIFPALVSFLGSGELSPFWAVLFYFSLVTFGIAQQLAIWFSVINGIIAFRACCLKSWETTITFCACACGFLCSLPFATELGISIMHFFDYTVGSAWWIMIIYVMQLAAVLIVRGRPYNSESIVAVFVRGSGCLANWCSPLLTFSWSVVTPAGLIVLSIASFKLGDFSELFSWRLTSGYANWSLWVRQCGCMICLIPLLLVPFIGIVQSILYLCKNHPSDLFDRIKLLYRPNFRTYIVRPERPEPRHPSRRQHRRERRTQRSRSPSPRPTPQVSDPPPKYTPPPTYNTATGARIAKLLRQSFRRSFRHIRNLTNLNQAVAQSLTELELGPTTTQEPQPTQPQQMNLPPAYTAVIMEIARTGDTHNELPLNEGHRQVQLNGPEITAASAGPGASATSLTHFLREGLRSSARQTMRASMRLLRGRKNDSIDDGSEGNQTEGDTEAGLVQGAVPIYQEPAPTHSVTQPVISLPPGSETTESVA